MRASSLRMLTIVVTTLLLGLLALVIWLVMRTDHAAAPASAGGQTRPPVTAATAPEATAAPTETDSPAGLETLPAGGFAFTPPAGYASSRTDTAITLTGPAQSGALNPVFLLSGGAPGQFVAGDADNLAAIFEEFVTYFAEQDNFEPGPTQELTVDGAPALAADIVSREEADGFAGRIVMARPGPERIFVMVGVGPAAQWQAEVAARYEEVLTGIDLLDTSTAGASDSESTGDSAAPGTTTTPPPAEAASATTEATITVTTVAATAEGAPTASPAPTDATEGNPIVLATAPPTVTPRPADAALPTPPATLDADPGPMALLNANFVNEIAFAGDNLWAATQGGIVAWSRENGAFARFSTLDGLRVNQFDAADACLLPGLGLVFGGPAGLQIFDLQTGRWNSLNTGNSAMSFDDVVALWCDSKNSYLVLGYAHHGLDVFDAVTSEWTHLDRNDGLGADIVEDVAVAGDRGAYWVSSGIGLSVIRDDEAQIFNAANSPLEVAPLHGLDVTPNGSVWIAGTRRLYRVDSGDEWTVYDAAALGAGFPAAPLAGLTATGDGSIWLADEAATICRFDVLAERCVDVYAGEPGMAAGPVTDIASGSDGAIAYATDGNGVSLFNGRTWRMLDVPGEALLSNAVHALATDRDGFIWLAADGGVQQFSPAAPQLMRNYAWTEELPLTSVAAIAPAPISGVWFGGEDGAALRDEDGWRRFTVADGLADDRVQALTADHRRRMWIGTRAGLSIWNGEEFFNLTRENGLPSDNITALASDSESVWIGTDSGGLYRFINNQLRVYNTQNAGLPSDAVTSLALLSDGALLAGTEQGLVRFVDGQGTLIGDLPAAPISSLAADGQGRAWCGVTNDGLYEFDGEIWRKVEAGMPSVTISALTTDQYGALWVGGESGGVLRMAE
ncbi:MAG: hypothetical protein KDD92_05065 [Caldilineaceae bacterium]|nr:hypothetical protein [Caldilineaceae bacterium]